MPVTMDDSQESFFDNVKIASTSEIYSLSRSFYEDPHPQKVNLAIESKCLIIYIYYPDIIHGTSKLYPICILYTRIQTLTRQINGLTIDQANGCTCIQTFACVILNATMLNT